MEINLFNEQTIKVIKKYIDDNQYRLKLNDKLFNIYENQIGPILDERLKDDLGNETYRHAEYRKSPVNILKKIVDKLSRIYQQQPRREVVDGNDRDSFILETFEQLLNIDHKMNIHNEFFNLFMYSMIQIGNDNGTPFIRTIPNHKYLIMNTSHIDPTSPDVVILFMDEVIEEGQKKDIYWVYTDEQFAIYDSTMTVRTDIMQQMEQDGTIPYGQKPFSYLNASENLVMPLTQDDTLDMTLLIPLLLTDTSFIAKYSAFSIIYGVDVDDEEMKMAPNAFWRLKSDTESDKNPSIGMIKPQGDVEQLIRLATSQLAMWLQSKGIKPGSIGNLDVNQISSGVSKLIDEADVNEIRKYQSMIYERFETEFWDLLLKKIYPFWVEQQLFDNLGTFSPNAKVVVNFAPQTPLQDRGQQVRDLKDEVEAGFNTKRRAIMTLNPQMTEKEVDELLADIEEEEEANREVFSFGQSIQQEDETNPEGSQLPSK